MDVEVPIRKLGNKVRLSRQISVSHDQPLGQGLVVLPKPQLELDARWLAKEQMQVRRAIDCYCPDHAARSDAGQKCLARRLSQKIGKRKIDPETTDEFLHHGLVGPSRYGN